MADALHDQSAAANDIGYVIDQVDRMLFRLGFYFIDSMGTLMRHNQDLAKRFDKVNQQVYVVHNEMTVFQIRSQGPGHMSGDQPNEDGPDRRIHRKNGDDGISTAIRRNA